jgi:hypothetical protein
MAAAAQHRQERQMDSGVAPHVYGRGVPRVGAVFSPARLQTREARKLRRL